MSSFVNERTIEYLLVCELNQIFKNDYKIYPFYYWKSREGNKTSKESFRDCKIRVLTVFARRPKVSFTYSTFFDVKINNALFQHSIELKKLGINSIAGSCLGNSFESLHISSKTNWYSLECNSNEDVTLTYLIENLEKPYENFQNIKLLSQKDIMKIVNESDLFSWKEILEKIDKWRNLGSINSFYKSFMGGIYGGYKPIFILLLEDKTNQ